MIEALTLDICGHSLHITRGKMMQCLVLRYQLPIFDKAFASVFQNWSTLYPTANKLRDELPMPFDQSFNEIFDEMRAIFSNFGEEVPYDEETIKDQVIADPEFVDWFRLAGTYWERAYQILEYAAFDIENTPQSNIAENVGFVGFGIRGMLGAALANAATNLLDRGINQGKVEMKLQKYDRQLDELLHGEETIREFWTVAALTADRICDYTVATIAIKTGEGCVFFTGEDENILEKRQYKSSSIDEKITICIAELEKYPAERDIYDELVRLTRGKVDSLIEYGNSLIEENYGSKTKYRVAKEIYDSTTQMAENTLDEIDRKLSSMEELLDIYEEKEVVEQEISRLTDIKKQKERTNGASAKVRELMLLLEKAPMDKVSSEKMCQSDGYFVFIQESFLSKNNYEKLPNDAMIRRCAELENGTPLLLKIESMGLDGKDAIGDWTYWARKGNPYALMRLGLCRLHGYGIEKDIVRSRQLLLRAAENNYTPAAYILYQISIGKYMPDFGHPTPEDKKYEFDVKDCGFPEEVFEKYREFGHS